MLQADKKYVYGTLAEKLQNPQLEENINKKTVRKVKKAPKSKIKPLLTVFICFAISIIILYRYSIITEQSFGLNQEIRHYRELKKSNDALRLEIQSAIDLGNIEKTAKEKLGMQKPDRSQFVYVSVPKSDQVIVAENFNDEAYGMDGKKSTMAVLMDKLNRLVQFLY